MTNWVGKDWDKLLGVMMARDVPLDVGAWYSDVEHGRIVHSLGRSEGHDERSIMSKISLHS